jgi:hypothetical protein
VLRDHKTAIGWILADIKGISPSTCMHCIVLEDETKFSRALQRRLNPLTMEVVKSEVSKLLKVGIIFPITNSRWVSPIHVVPTKIRITIIENKKGKRFLLDFKIVREFAPIIGHLMPTLGRTIFLYLSWTKC